MCMVAILGVALFLFVSFGLSRHVYVVDVLGVHGSFVCMHVQRLLSELIVFIVFTVGPLDLFDV